MRALVWGFFGCRGGGSPPRPFLGVSRRCGLCSSAASASAAAFSSKETVDECKKQGGPLSGGPPVSLGAEKRRSSRPSASFWGLYVRGLNPKDPSREQMFRVLTAEGICVQAMSRAEVSQATLWLQQRALYGDPFPQFPNDISLQDKLQSLKEKYPLNTNTSNNNK